MNNRDLILEEPNHTLTTEVRKLQDNERKLSVFKLLVGGLVDLIYAPFCAACDVKLRPQEETVCLRCWGRLDETLLGNWVEQLSLSDSLDAAFSGWYFDDVLQQIIHALKYEEKRSVAGGLAKRLAGLFRVEIESLMFDAVVPIPLHSAKLRQRGFNQSESIAAPLAKELKIEYAPDLLRRRKNTISQTTLSLEERKENVSRAFKSEDLKDHKRILIVDDILTTGATVTSSAAALKDAGAEFVAVLTVGTPYLEAPEDGSQEGIRP